MQLRWSLNLLDLASQAVEGRAELYNGFTAVKGARGGGMFKLHQDNMYTRHDNGDRTTPRTPEVGLRCVVTNIRPLTHCISDILLADYGRIPISEATIRPSPRATRMAGDPVVSGSRCTTCSPRTPARVATGGEAILMRL